MVACDVSLLLSISFSLSFTLINTFSRYSNASRLYFKSKKERNNIFKKKNGGERKRNNTSLCQPFIPHRNNWKNIFSLRRKASSSFGKGYFLNKNGTPCRTITMWHAFSQSLSRKKKERKENLQLLESKISLLSFAREASNTGHNDAN